LPAFAAAASRRTRLVRIVFGDLTQCPVEAKFAEHFARRQAIVEERFGQIETIDIMCAFEFWQAGESQMNLRQNLVAALPLFRCLFDILGDIARNAMPIGNTEQSQKPLPVGFDR